MRRIVSFGPAAVVLLAVFTAMWAAPSLVGRVRHAATLTQVSLAQQTIDSDDILGRMQAQTRSIADAVEPSVVHIEVGFSRRGRGAAGSGWVYDADGHIVTNAHVVRGVDRVSVLFGDGRLTGGEVLAIDEFTDIAVIRVDPGPGLAPAARATGARVRQGDFVFAFGSPFGFKFSMSQGIVSGLGRAPSSALDFGGYTNFIQTDAAVNPGNSGGPLVDIRGRVIGMNVAIATGADTNGTTDGQSAGISFAIPLATIESVVDQLVGEGRVTRGFLGITMTNSVQRIEREGLYVGSGIVVTRVEPGGPADRSGLRAEDVITHVAEQPLDSSDILRSVVSAHRPGEALRVDILRDGLPRTIDVELGEMPVHVLLDGPTQRRIQMRLGLLDIAPGDGGVLVNRVMEASPAGRAGIKDGAVIARVGNEPVRSDTDFFQALYNAGLLAGREVELQVKSRDSGETSRVTVRLRG